MTKEQILKDFDDINFMYNNPMMLDSLERHIDELLEDVMNDLSIVSEALLGIVEHECCSYGMDDACDIASKYIKEGDENG